MKKIIIPFSLILIVVSCTKDFPELAIEGCLDSTAINYNSNANIDDGSCCFDIFLFGCTDPNANNYNSNACFDDGSCTYPYADVKFFGYDSYGDKWNGATFTITDDSGTEIITGDGTGYWDSEDKEFEVSFTLPTGCYDLVVTGGSYPSEVSFDLIIPTPFQTLASGGPGNYNNICINLK